MNKIIEFSRQVYNVIGFQEYYTEKNYVNSIFLINEEVIDGNLIYNTLTCELILINDMEYEDYKEYLISHWFLLPDDIDQYSLCKTFKFIYQKKYKKESIGKISNYTILTTTNCNARCPYCYEIGCKKIDMSINTALDVTDFIKRTNNGNFHIKWFGGEPLCNSNVIDSISDKLNEEGLLFSSTMISNGYLFDKYDETTLKYLWRLERVQITLDGTQENYNKTKSYIYPETNPFEKVLNNIEYLLSNDIMVNVRVNISKDNIIDIERLLNLLYDCFHGYRKFFVYSHPLFDLSKVRNENEKNTIKDEYISIQRKLKNIKFLPDYHLDLNRCYRNCIADNMKSVVINPEGRLSLCEHYFDSEFIGDIYNTQYNIKKIHEWNKKYEIDRCKSCPLFPQCTKIKKCPVGECSDQWREHLEFQIRDSMKNAYKRMVDNYGKSNNL